MNRLPRSIYFSGIGGSGVSAIACFAASRGHRVAGSDRAFEQPGATHPALPLLRDEGVEIVSQDGSSLDSSYELLVISTAVESDRPEVVKANELGIPIRTRPRFLADIVNGFRSIAVAGTSGKSTTSGMLANALASLGENVNFLGGGRVLGLGQGGRDTNYRAGDSDRLVFEADESDGSIVSYRPEHTVLLNLDLDHNPVEETAQMFRTLLDNTRGLRLLNADDAHLKALMPENAVTFSLESPSSHRAEHVELKAFGSAFTLHGTRFTLTVPGRHNAYNALACASMLIELGHSPEAASRALASFRGISRRFNVYLNDHRGLVIDDYAHNPHKLSFLMETVRRAVPGPVCYVFQPHGFGPTRLMKDSYIRAFSEGLREQDMLVLLPIFYSGGTVAKDISSEVLAQGVRSNGGMAQAVQDRNDVLKMSDEFHSFVILGARDESLSTLARDISFKLSKGLSG